DLESSALFVPGGLQGLTKRAFGAGASTLSASALIVQYVLFGTLAASAAAQALVAGSGLIPTTLISSRQITLDASTTLAACAIGVVWWWLRQGRTLPAAVVTRVLAAAITTLAVVVVLGLVKAVSSGAVVEWVALPPGVGLSPISVAVALGACLF